MDRFEILFGNRIWIYRKLSSSIVNDCEFEDIKQTALMIYYENLEYINNQNDLIATRFILNETKKIVKKDNFMNRHMDKPEYIESVYKTMGNIYYNYTQTIEDSDFTKEKNETHKLEDLKEFFGEDDYNFLIYYLGYKKMKTSQRYKMKMADVDKKYTQLIESAKDIFC